MSTTAEQNDALTRKLEHSIRLPAFEGPLDLLLFLIRRNEVDIYDIPIESVTRQYLDVLGKMEHMDLEIAGDFFVMASTLMYIKSRMLLPKNEQLPEDSEDAEEIDPRWELVQQLIEYKKFKEAAFDIDQLISNQQDMLARIFIEDEEQKEERPLVQSDKIELWNTFNLVLRRLAEKIQQGEIHDEQVSVADRMEFILHRLETEKTFTFSSLIQEGDSFNVLAATFLAVLELARLKHLVLQQDEAFADICCTRCENEEQIKPVEAQVSTEE